jgi:tetratricopeptide (TPR) repeat protein
MSESPNKLIRFWQELKRRKVFGVVTTYAATAYIIIEVINNIVSPLHLPAWIPTLVILLLIAGLPVAIILSWIFDFTPQGIKKTESLEELEGKEIGIKPVKRKLRASYVLNAILIIAVIILVYPKIFKRDTLERLRSKGEKISVAVMPFQNFTNDTIWNIYQLGIQDNLINYLSNNPEELQVRQTESIINILKSKGFTNYASITPSVASTISQDLDANVFIYGSLNQSGSTIRLNARIVDSKTEDALKSFQIDGKAENILPLIDSLSVILKNFLIITKLQKKVSSEYEQYINTNSPDAYRYFVYGYNAFNEYDMLNAIKLFSQAIAIDSNFFYAFYKVSIAYLNEAMYDPGKLYDQVELYDQAKQWCLRVYEQVDQMPIHLKNLVSRLHAVCFETPYEEIKYLRQLQEFDDQSPDTYYLLGWTYSDRLHQYDKAIPEFEKALEIYNKWGSKPDWIYNYYFLGHAYHETGQFKKEKQLYKKAEQDFPDVMLLSYRQAILSLSEGDSVAAKRYKEIGISYMKSMSLSDAIIASVFAFLYSEAGLMDNAEDYFRQAISLEPENPELLNALSYFLIDKDRNINEGLELTDKALVLNPENYNYMHTKGWGLFKQGKYQEALDILQKSWDLRRQYAIYNHDAWLHLEEAQKAVASQKNN